MIDRLHIVSKLVEYFENIGLNEVYGNIVGLSDDKKYRTVTFCKARYIDGLVRVYSPGFILVIINNEPNLVFKSFNETMSYFYNRFGEPD